ncbi:MAG: hypothetical protein V1719_00815 [Patescibacteria group bacterium]
MTKSPEALCSANGYATTYHTYNVDIDLTDREVGIFNNDLISLDDESLLKFSAGIWWENCKHGPYWDNQSCWAYFLSNNAKYPGWHKYYPDGTTDSPNVVPGDEIFYVPPLIKQWGYPLINIPTNMTQPLDYTNKIKIPGDFAVNNYSALEQIQDLDCLEGLVIPATFPYNASPSPGQPLRALPALSFGPSILLSTYPVIDLTPLSNLTNLRVLYINNIRIESQQNSKNTNKVRIVPIENGTTRKMDYSAISELNELRVLYMQDTDAERISFLSALTNLKLLDLSWNNYIEQIAPILWVPQLEKLYLRFIPQIDLSTTASLELGDQGKLKIKQTPFLKLEEISLEGTSVERIDAFKMAPDLQIIDLSSGLCTADTGGTIADRMLCRLAQIDLAPFNIIDGIKQLKISGRYITQNDCYNLNQHLPNTKITCAPDPRTD